jgi:hypothetical protein
VLPSQKKKRKKKEKEKEGERKRIERPLNGKSLHVSLLVRLRVALAT